MCKANWNRWYTAEKMSEIEDANFMSINAWKILGSTYLRPRFRIDQCELPNGRSFEPIVFEFRSWAIVIALTKDQEVVMIRQYRHGIRDVVWEFPGGIVEDGEDPLDGVKRELLEETGYRASKLVEVGKYYPNPALQTNSMYCYLAFDAEKVSGQTLDETEEIEVHLVPLTDLIAMTKRGDFSHGLQVAGLFYALAYLDRIC